MPLLTLVIALGVVTGHVDFLRPLRPDRLVPGAVLTHEQMKALTDEQKKMVREFEAIQSSLSSGQKRTIADRREMIAKLTDSIARFEARLDELRKNGAAEDSRAVKNVQIAIDMSRQHRAMLESMLPKRTDRDR